MAKQRFFFAVVLKVDRFNSFFLKAELVAFHRRAMQPQLLLVKGCRVLAVAEEEAVLDQDGFGRAEFEPGVVSEQLMWKN